MLLPLVASQDVKVRPYCWRQPQLWSYVMIKKRPEVWKEDMGESGESRRGGNDVNTVLLYRILKKPKETKTPVMAGSPQEAQGSEYKWCRHHSIVSSIKRKLLYASVMNKNSCLHKNSSTDIHSSPKVGRDQTSITDHQSTETGHGGTFSPRTPEAEAGSSLWIQSQPNLCGEFQDSQAYILRSSPSSAPPNTQIIIMII